MSILAFVVRTMCQAILEDGLGVVVIVALVVVVRLTVNRYIR